MKPLKRAPALAILIMRTYALYQNKFVLLALLSTGLVGLFSGRILLLRFFIDLFTQVTMGAMSACFSALFRVETRRHQIMLVNNYPQSLTTSLSDIPASLIGLTGCLFSCAGPLCHPLLVTFWMPFLLFESRKFPPHLYLKLSSLLTIDTPCTVIFTLTVWKSYKSCMLPHLMSTGKILTGLYIVTTMPTKGTTTIIEVLMRDGQYFSTVIYQVLVLNTFDSPGILYYVGEPKLEILNDF